MNKSRSAILPAYNDNLLRAMLALKVEERTLPGLQKDEVLVKMEGAPCNPSDIAFLRGGYNIVKPLPAVPGFEGAGTVVETGTEARSLMGKRVSCFVQEDNDGTWAEYFIAKSKDCILLKAGVDWMQAACLSINPITAWAMFEMVEKAGCKAFIQDAAGGQVPAIMQKLADRKGIRVINLVRKSEAADALKNRGTSYVLNTGEEHFLEQLRQYCDELQPAFAFDAVGGDLAGAMLNAMPDGSRVIVYGALSGSSIAGIDPMGVIFRNKSVTGFNLNDWLANLTTDELTAITDKIQDLVIAGDIQTAVQGTFPLDRVVEGIRTYIKSMSAGKIIFTP